jgi:predicted nucleic acid-binding Zn ribbon protein
MKRKIDRLSTTIAKILKSRGLESGLSEYKVFGNWEKTVGEVIALHAHPAMVRGKKLTLIVDSPAWMQQLSLMKPELIKKMNRDLGKESIREITLKLGEVAPPKKTVDALPARVRLDEEERVTIERYVQEVLDPDIRDAIRRVMEKDLLSRKKEQKRQ